VFGGNFELEIIKELQGLMNQISKSFYSRDMFEFIHHPKYGCHDYYGLTPKEPNVCTADKLVLVSVT
jgi:hypothetical protein